jgi:electron transfer flavoprotein alpha subunit
MSTNEQVAKIGGVKSVVYADNAAYEHALPENLSLLVADLQKAKSYTHVVSASTAVGKGVLPRVAVTLNVQPITDVINIESPDTFVRPVYAGNALSTVKVSRPIRVLCVRAWLYADPPLLTIPFVLFVCLLFALRSPMMPSNS